MVRVMVKVISRFGQFGGFDVFDVFEGQFGSVEGLEEAC